MCYDANMAMLNHGFLTLVKMEFFNWGRDLMRLVRSSLSEKDTDYDPKNCFDKAETTIMANALIKSWFHKLCMQHSGVTNKEEIEGVYLTFVSRIIHARFGVRIRRWKENNVKRNAQASLQNTKICCSYTFSNNSGCDNTSSDKTCMHQSVRMEKDDGLHAEEWVEKSRS